MRKLIVVTQQVDPASAVLGATVPKLRALAERVEELVVLTDSAAEGALPDNVTIRTFNASRRAGRGMRFESALARELSRRPRPSAVLAHMCPIYAVLAAPLARPTGVKVLLWFTHWRRSALLSTATRASSKVLSVDKRTFPIKTRKLVAIGHGIDVSDLPCVKRPEDREPFTLLALGRTSPAKGLVTILRAVEQVPEVRLRIVGPSLTEEERMHRIALDRLVIELGLLDRVDISGPVPRQAIPSLYADARQRHAGGRRGQGRLRGGRDVPAGDRLEPRLRHAPSRAAAVRAREPGEPRGRDPLRARGRPAGARADTARHRDAGALGRRLGRPRRRARWVSLRILHVAKVAGISGSENHLLLLLPALRARGHDVRLVMLHEDEPGAAELADRLEHDGVPVDRMRMRASVDPLVFGRLARSIRRARPDVVHTHLVHADFHGLTAARLARVPLLVSTKHGFNPFRSRRAFAAADRTVARLADVHVAISAGLARYLAENEGFDASAFEVVHYGIEPGPEPPSPPGEPRLAIVGRLIPIKGHEVLLEALRLARDDVPELTL